MFDANRYKDLVITARIDVGASTLWSEAVSISNLGNLLSSNLITFTEYLERIPKGLIPNVNGLINARKRQEQQENMSADDISDYEILEYIKQNNPKLYEEFLRLSPEDRLRAFSMMRSNNTSEPVQENLNNKVEGDL